MGLRDAAALGQALFDLSGGTYIGMYLMEHGGRLARELSGDEELLVSGFASRFQGTRNGCGLLVTSHRLVLMPERGFQRPGGLLAGALFGKGDVFSIPPEAIADATTETSFETPNVLMQVVTHRYTGDDLTIRLQDGTELSFESMLGAGVHFMIKHTLLNSEPHPG